MFDALADSISADTAHTKEETLAPVHSRRPSHRAIQIAHVGYTDTEEDRDRRLQVRIWLSRNDPYLYSSWFEAVSDSTITEDFIDLNGTPSRDFLSEDYCYDVVVIHNIWGFPDAFEIGGSGPAACSVRHGVIEWRKRLQHSRARYLFLLGADFQIDSSGSPLPGYDCYFVPSVCFMTVLVSAELSGKLPAPTQGISLRDMASSRLRCLPELLDNRSLDLSYTTVTGNLLVLLKKMIRLEDLRLVGTCVTDDDLALVAQCPSIRKLNLDASNISGAGLAHLRELDALEALSLNETNVDSDSLRNLEQFPRLSWLSLLGTRVGDDGLNCLASIKTLRSLILVGTRVTAEGAEKLRHALPQCTVDSRQ